MTTSTKNSETIITVRNGEIVNTEIVDDINFWQSFEKFFFNSLKKFLNHQDTKANIIGGSGFEDIQLYIKLNNSFKEKLIQQQETNPDLNPLETTISAGGQVMVEYMLNEAINFNSQSDFVINSNASISGIKIVDHNQNSIFDVAISAINSDVAQNVAKPLNDIIKDHFNNKNSDKLVFKDSESNSQITIDQNNSSIDFQTSTPLTEEQKASTLQAIAPLIKPTDDNASPIESIILNDDEYIPFNTDLSDYQETNLLIDGETLDITQFQSLLLNYILKDKIFLLNWQKKLVFNYYNIN
jgi:hypothetical protein